MKTEPAAIYARYSSGNQREASIEDQLRICREYCKENGLTVAHEYTDHALTGRTDRRPGFLEMVTDGERKKFSVLVVYSMDRLSRDRYDLAVYKHRLKKAGVRFVYVTQPLGETPEAALMESLLEGMAAYYSENLSRSVRRGLEGNALKGIVTTGRAPFGYRLTPERRLEPDPVTAPVVKEIFERYASGESRASIIADLNARHFKTAMNRPFQRTSLDVILQNDVYTGVFHWRDIRRENAVPPLISRELFDSVQAAAERNKTRRGSGKAAEEFYLTGKLFCAKCGASMVGDSGTSRAGKTYLYYTCTRHKRGNRCPQRSVPKTVLEDAVLEACAAALTDENIIAVAKAAEEFNRRELEQNDAVPALKASIAENTKRINNILSAIEQGVITPTTKQRLNDLETERADLEEQLARAEIERPLIPAAAFAAYLARFRNADPADPDDRRQLISGVLHHATVADEAENIKIELTFNLKTSSTAHIPCSDDAVQVGLTLRNPNVTVFADRFVCVKLIRR